MNPTILSAVNIINIPLRKMGRFVSFKKDKCQVIGAQEAKSQKKKGGTPLLLEQLDTFIQRYQELAELLSDPEVINDNKRFRELAKEEADLRPKVETFKRYKEVVQGISDTEEIIKETSDDEMLELAKMELEDLKSEEEELEQKIRILMLPTDPNDDKNIIMEIRGAAGGDEALSLIHI